jgi:hypothetical protein
MRQLRAAGRTPEAHTPETSLGQQQPAPPGGPATEEGSVGGGAEGQAAASVTGELGGLGATKRQVGRGQYDPRPAKWSRPSTKAAYKYMQQRQKEFLRNQALKAEKGVCLCTYKCVYIGMV